MPPVNDNFASATVISGVSGTVTVNNTGATEEVGEPNLAFVGKTAWFQWTAPSKGDAEFDTLSSVAPITDTCLGVYTGIAVGSLTQIGFNDDYGANWLSSLTFLAEAGTTYYVQVGTLGGSEEGVISLSWAFSPWPPAVKTNFVGTLTVDQSDIRAINLEGVVVGRTRYQAGAGGDNCGVVVTPDMNWIVTCGAVNPFSDARGDIRIFDGTTGLLDHEIIAADAALFPGAIALRANGNLLVCASPPVDNSDAEVREYSLGGTLIDTYPGVLPHRVSPAIQDQICYMDVIGDTLYYAAFKNTLGPHWDEVFTYDLSIKTRITSLVAGLGPNGVWGVRVTAAGVVFGVANPDPTVPRLQYLAFNGTPIWTQALAGYDIGLWALALTETTVRVFARDTSNPNNWMFFEVLLSDGSFTAPVALSTFDNICAWAIDPFANCVTTSSAQLIT